MKLHKNGAEAVDSPESSPSPDEKLETSTHYSDQNDSDSDKENPEDADKVEKHYDGEQENEIKQTSRDCWDNESSNDVSNGQDESFEDKHDSQDKLEEGMTIESGQDESFEERHDSQGEPEEGMTIESVPIDESFNESEPCDEVPSENEEERPEAGGSSDECSRSEPEWDKTIGNVRDHDDARASDDEDLSTGPCKLSDNESRDSVDMQKSPDESMGFAVTEDYIESINVDDPNESTGFSISENCSDDERFVESENKDMETIENSYTEREDDNSFLDKSLKSPEGNINETITSYSFVESPKVKESAEENYPHEDDEFYHAEAEDTSKSPSKLFEEENTSKSPSKLFMEGQDQTESPVEPLEYPHEDDDGNDEEPEKQEKHSSLHDDTSGSVEEKLGSPSPQKEFSDGQMPYSPELQEESNAPEIISETSEHNMEVDDLAAVEKTDNINNESSVTEVFEASEPVNDALEEKEAGPNDTANECEISSNQMVQDDFPPDQAVGPRTPTGPEPEVSGSLPSSPQTLTNMSSVEPTCAPSADHSFESTDSEDAPPAFEMMTDNEYVSASK